VLICVSGIDLKYTVIDAAAARLRSACGFVSFFRFCRW
jgi:hypothetical protein